MVEEREDLTGLSAYQVPQARLAVELDSNESPWNLPDEITDEISKRMEGFDFNRYPDISASPLREALADVYGLKMENVLVGNGSNEVILDLLLAFGGAGRTVVTFEPTYTMHGVIARMSGTRIVSVPLKPGFSIDIDEAEDRIKAEKPSIVFVCNPNNPTGTLTPLSDIERLLVFEDTLIVVDEAYGEFAEESAIPLIGTVPNLAVVKTFSKAFRMASQRVGFALAGENVLASVNKVKLPYNVSALSQLCAEVVLKNRALLIEGLNEIIAERDRVFSALYAMDGIEATPSSANFILFKTDTPAAEVFSSLLDQGVLVRDFSTKPGLEGCLRVTVGAPEQNDVFLSALGRAVSRG